MIFYVTLGAVIAVAYLGVYASIGRQLARRRRELGGRPKNS